MWNKFDQFIKINPKLGVSQLKKKLIKLDKRCKKMLSRNQLEENNRLLKTLLKTIEQKHADEIKDLSEKFDHKLDQMAQTYSKNIQTLMDNQTDAVEKLKKKKNKKIKKLKRKLADGQESTPKKAKNSKTMKQINEELFEI